MKALYRKAQVQDLMGRTDEALETIAAFYALYGCDETSNDGKLFKVLKQQVLKRAEADKIKSKELANKMLNPQPDPQPAVSSTQPPVTD